MEGERPADSPLGGTGMVMGSLGDSRACEHRGAIRRHVKAQHAFGTNAAADPACAGAGRGYALGILGHEHAGHGGRAEARPRRAEHGG